MILLFLMMMMIIIIKSHDDYHRLLLLLFFKKKIPISKKKFKEKNKQTNKQAKKKLDKNHWAYDQYEFLDYLEDEHILQIYHRCICSRRIYVQDACLANSNQ